MFNNYAVIGAQYMCDQRKILAVFRTRTAAENYIDSINGRGWAWIEIFSWNKVN